MKLKDVGITTILKEALEEKGLIMGPGLGEHCCALVLGIWREQSNVNKWEGFM